MKRKYPIGVRPTNSESRFTGETTYSVKIMVNRHSFYMGTYSYEWQAALAYDRAIYFSRPFVAKVADKVFGAGLTDAKRRDNGMLLHEPDHLFCSKEEVAMTDYLKRSTGLENDL